MAFFSRLGYSRRIAWPGLGWALLLGAAIGAGAGGAAVLWTSGPFADKERVQTPTISALGSTIPLEAEKLQVQVFSGSAPLKAGAPAAEEGLIDGPPAAARFAGIADISLDSKGNLIVAEYRNRVIRRVSPSGDVETLAGSGKQGSDDGPAALATFRSPVSAAEGPDGTVYVVDGYASTIRAISPAGVVRTIAGVDAVACDPPPVKDAAGLPVPSAPIPPACPEPYTSLYRDGAGAQALFDEPTSLLVLPDGSLLVSDWDNHCLRHIDRAEMVTTFAGKCTQPGYRDGDRDSALFTSPGDLALGPDGSIYVTDGFSRVRRILPDGTVTTLSSTFLGPSGIAVDQWGNLYVADNQNQIVQVVTAGGQARTLAGSSGQGFKTGGAAQAQFSYPAGLAIGRDGNLYVADSNLNRIFVISAAP